MRHLFIINPAAGKKQSTAHLEELLKKLSFEHETVYTTGEGDARRIAEEAARRGDPVRIYACGGDGTLNEVVNGAAGYDHVAVTNVPKGTGNDFLKLFGENFRETFYDLEELAVGPQTPMDLIDCNGHLGIDVVCTGIDARIGAGVHRYKNWRFVSGMGAYCLSLVEHVLFKGVNRPMTVDLEDEHWEGNAALMCICNGRHYGGGFNPMPEAMPDDGVLDMLLVPGVSLFTLVCVIGKYAKGRYKELPHLVKEYHRQGVEISSDREMTTVVDGEVLTGRRFVIRLSEKKVNFFYPAGADYGVKISTPAKSL